MVTNAKALTVAHSLATTTHNPNKSCLRPATAQDHVAIQRGKREITNALYAMQNGIKVYF